MESEAGKENEKKLDKLKNRKKQNGVIGVSNGVPHYGEVSWINFLKLVKEFNSVKFRLVRHEIVEMFN